MKKAARLFLLACLAFCGCKTLADISSERAMPEHLNKSDFKNLNGYYSNSSTEVVGKRGLYPGGRWKPVEKSNLLPLLYKRLPAGEVREADTVTREKVQIHFNSPRMAVVSLYRNDSLAYSIRIKGRFKEGFFYLRPKNYAVPFFPVWFGYNAERARMGMAGHGLLIDYRLSMWGFALFGGTDTRVEISSVFASLNDEQLPAEDLLPAF